MPQQPSNVPVYVLEPAMLRKPTIVEVLTIVGIIVVLVVLLFDDGTSAARRRIQRRARDWKQTTVPTLSDATLLTSDSNIAGEWTRGSRLERTRIEFTARPDSRYDVKFTTSGCVGGCSFKRIASLSGGVITLDQAVAEYAPLAYNTLYTIHIDDVDYLVPAERLDQFEQALASGSHLWKWHVFSRGNGAASESPPPEPGEQSGIDEATVLAIARMAVIKNDTWIAQAEFEAPRRTESGWSVLVWRLPKVAGGHRVVSINEAGEVTGYSRGR